MPGLLSDADDLAFVETFGEEVTVPGGGTVLAIFTAAGRAVRPNHITSETETTAPTLILRTLDAQAAGLALRDLVEVGGRQFEVARPPRDDGTGITTVHLYERDA